ncbi:MAG: HAD family hydrolase [Granulosicoccaceae bacterium]
MKGFVFCDIDGCLNLHKNTPFDLPRLMQVRELVPQLAAKGVGFALCTGRPQPYAEAMAQLLGLETPLVCEGGAMVYEPLGDNYRPMASADSVRAITALQADLQASGLLRDTLYFEVGNAYSLCLTGPAISGQSQTGIRAQMERLKAQYADYPVSWSHSTTSIDITPVDINKGSGLRAICADYNVPLARTAGIGDSNGDVGMFQTTARGYCPDNASDELKLLAAYVSAHRYTEGTLDILNVIAADASLYE